MSTPVTARLEPRLRDVREVIRDEQFMRGRILNVLESGPQTIPQIKEVDDDGYFPYQVVPREES